MTGIGFLLFAVLMLVMGLARCSRDLMGANHIVWRVTRKPPIASHGISTERPQAAKLTKVHFY